jgi:hypothetical protein
MTEQRKTVTGVFGVTRRRVMVIVARGTEIARVWGGVPGRRVGEGVVVALTEESPMRAHAQCRIVDVLPARAVVSGLTQTVGF